MDKKTLILTNDEIKQLIDMPAVLTSVENAFKLHGKNLVQMPAKIYLHLDKYSGDFRAMPAYIEGMEICGIKWVNVHPKNRRFVLPAVMAIIILSDPRNGFPLCIMDATLITNLRTGAAGGIAAKYLARKDSSIVGLVGCGVQARSQLMALKELFKIKSVYVWGKDSACTKRFLKDTKYFHLDIKIKDKISDCVKEADIVVTTTPARKPIVKLEWIKEGTHINAIGADARGKEELEPELLKKAKIVVDDRQQACHGGEINVPLSKRIITEKDIYATLGEVLNRKKKGRITPKEITIFDSTGLAIQDVAVANLVYKSALKKKIGRRIGIIGLAMFINILILGASIGWPQQEQGFSRERETMVREQIEARGIKDERVLKALRRVKRHLFVPLRYRPLAYIDGPLPIAEGQTISQPYIVGLMTELLALKGNEKVLEIGTGSGYQAAILAELAKEVYTIEILEPLAKAAERLLKELGYRNVYVKVGDGFLGWPEQAPFDAIIVTCAPADIPGPLMEQLAEGARLVIPVGRDWQELKLVQKREGKIVSANIIPVRFVPMLRDKISMIEDAGEDEEMIENLERHILSLSNEIGERNFLRYQNLERASDYIKQEFKNYGYGLEEQVYSLWGKSFRNIIATKKGRIQPEKIIIACAHYDSISGSPGADDNASGVAGLLELARTLSKEDLKKTIKFIAFTNEEPPLFMTNDMGSLRYAREAKRRGDDILGVLCLESIGYYSDEKGSQDYPFGFSLFYPDKGNFIAMVSNFSSRHLLKGIVKEFKKQSSLPVESLVGFGFLAPAVSFSDHWSFWKFGYKAMMITDTAFYRTPYYHTSADTMEKLDFALLSEVVKGLYAAIKSLL